MEKLDLLYEGKAKKVYKTDVEDVYKRQTEGRISDVMIPACGWTR